MDGVSVRLEVLRLNNEVEYRKQSHLVALLLCTVGNPKNRDSLHTNGLPWFFGSHARAPTSPRSACTRHEFRGAHCVRENRRSACTGYEFRGAQLHQRKTGGRRGLSNGFGAAHYDAISHCHHHDATPYNNVIFRHYYISLLCNILAIMDDTLFSLYYRTLKFANRDSMIDSVIDFVIDFMTP